MPLQTRGIIKDITEDEILEVKDLLANDEFDISGNYCKVLRSFAKPNSKQIQCMI